MIDIIPFRQEFQDEVVDHILSIQQTEFNIPISAQDQPDLFGIDNFYRRNGGEFWIAVSGTDVVGSIALIRISGNKGVIRKMFVNKEYRGKEFNVAQRLLNTLIRYSITKGIGALYLGTIDQFGAALRFYERNGFAFISKTNLPGDFPLMPLDNVFCEMLIEKDQGN